MKTVNIKPTTLKGSIKMPPSKSLSHRAIICAGLADGMSVIDNVILSEDIKATLRGIKCFGSEVTYAEDKADADVVSIAIKGNPRPRAVEDVLYCGESGSTLRFFLPFACLGDQGLTFTGGGELIKRPLDLYYDIFDDHGIGYTNTMGGLPLEVKEGTLKAGTFKIRGDISSQFITGLMFVLPLLDGDSVIEMATPLQSRAYVALTLEVLEKFGIDIKYEGFKRFYIKGRQRYGNTNYSVEGDYSQAAFWIVAGILGGTVVECKGMDAASLQGDKAIMDIVRKMGGALEVRGDIIKNSHGTATRGIVVDVSQCPDLVPIIAVLGAVSVGTTKIINGERLRIKECDRLRAISTELNRLGADITELGDGLIIKGKERLQGGKVSSWNDHRIAMALGIASIKCQDPVTIVGSDAVKKSYPHFWEDFVSLGGKIASLKS